MEFNREFQESLLLSLGNSEFVVGLNGYLTDEVFSAKLRPIATEVLEALHSGQKLSTDQIHQVATKHGLKLVGNANRSPAFDRTELERFCKDRLLKQSLALAQQLREEGKYEEAVGVVRDSLMPLETHYSLSDALKEPESGVGRVGHIGTGLEPMDDKLEGGLCPGELGVLIGPTSSGKTSMLSSFGVTALRAGNSVLHVTLEDSKREVLRKYRRALLGKLDYSIEEWQTMQVAMGGVRLNILEAGAWELDVKKIRSYVTSDTNLVIVDNADYLKPGYGSSGVKYEDLGHIFVELKNLSKACSVPVWTSSQINRSGYDKLYGNLEHVAGSLEKMMVSDLVLSLNQDIIQKGADAEGYSGLTIMCPKFRHGPRFWKLDCRVRFDLCKFEPIGDVENV